VTNGGEAVLNVSNISSEQTWVQQISATMFTLNPQATRQVNVTVGISGLAVGEHQGKLRISSNDPDTPTFLLPIVFNVLAAYPKYPKIVVSPDTLKFEIRLGNQTDSDTSQILIRNDGEARLTVNSIQSGSAWISAIIPNSFYLDPGNGRNVAVIVSTESIINAGKYTGSARIQSNDPDTPNVDIGIELTVLPPGYPAMLVEADTLFFVTRQGSEPPQDTTATFRIRNNGNADLIVSNINSLNSWYLNTVPATFTLSPGGNKNITVQVTDRYLSPGEYYGKLTIESNDPERPSHVVRMQINVLEAHPERPRIVASSDTLFFKTRKGTEPPQDTTATFTLRNDGTSDLIVSNINSLNSWYVSTTPTTFTLSPGGLKDITVLVTDRYLNPGEYYGKLTIESNDPDNPSYMIRMQINVFAALPHMSVEPESLTFTIKVGDEACCDTAYMNVLNHGPGILNVMDISSPADYITTISPNMFTLNRNLKQTVEVVVTANNLASGTYESVLHIISDDPDSSVYIVRLTLNLVPEMKQPTISVHPDTLMFEELLNQFTQSDTSYVTITNTGDALLEIKSIASNTDWIIAIEPNNFNVEPGLEAQVAIIISIDGLLPGIYNAQLAILSNDPETPEYPVYVIMDILITDVLFVTDGVPNLYRLEQNYPNPFNPETIIRYTVPEAEVVTITIFNTMGQKIKTIVDSEVSAGDHLVVWRADDENGVKVVSGIYLYQLRTTKGIFVRKMILLE